MAEKSIYKDEYKAALQVLRTLRQEAAEREGGTLTQAEFAKRVGRTQTFVSAAERGTTRLDAVQLQAWCYACGATLEEWGRRMDEALKPYLKQQQPKPKASTKTKPKAKSKLKRSAS